MGMVIPFGEVQSDPYEEGLHIPVNPFFEWYLYDVRQKSHLEEANVLSQDQLQTKIQVSVQFRLEKDRAPMILKETGQAADVLIVHIVPKLRSLLREQGKTIKRAEDFFLEKTQQNMQTSLLAGLQDYLYSKGVNVGWWRTPGPPKGPRGGVGSAYRPPGRSLVPPHKILKVVNRISA
ncbi:MAG: SPFH domain-containing protein [Candidatus Lambdaproteobacteria bacterium]